MLLVTGTKRSGTSMWMQLLAAAGLPLIGEAFPGPWEDRIKEANPRGFYESGLREGIYYRTNPDPASGEYLHPAATRRHVVKVFVPGLVRSDVAFIDRVLATMRHHREYGASLGRLYDMELRAKERETGSSIEPLYQMHPVLEWWNDNYELVRDHLTRRYPLHVVTYDAVLDEPERIVREAIRWLGGGDEDAAVAGVAPELRTQARGTRPRTSLDLPEWLAEHEAVFDELYERVHERRELEGAFLDRLNTTQDALEPHIERERRLQVRSAVAKKRSENDRRMRAEPALDEAAVVAALRE